MDGRSRMRRFTGARRSAGPGAAGPARLSAGLPAALCGALTLLGVGACGTDESPRPAAPTEDARTPAPLGPLELYLGDVVGGRTQGEVAAELAEREEAVAACMAEQGFEYVPVVMVPGSFEASDDPLRGTREFAEAYGYGVWRGPEIEPGQYTYMLDDGANRAYRESLSPEAGAAYDVALMGQPTDLGGGTVSYDGTGCQDVLSQHGSAEAEYLRGVRDEISDFLESLWAGDDPRLAEIDAAWASCMRDAGYDDDSPRAAEQRVIDEITAAYGSASAPSPGQVDERAAAERRLALADQDCRDATDWTARRRAAEHQLQQEYVDAHRTDLDALVAATEGDGVLD